MKMYYREKIIKIHDKMFDDYGDAKARMINCEDYIESAKMSRGSQPLEVKLRWEEIWKELNVKKGYDFGNGRRTSSFVETIRSKRNITLVKYLMFFSEEFYRVIDEDY